MERIFSLLLASSDATIFFPKEIMAQTGDARLVSNLVEKLMQTAMQQSSFFFPSSIWMQQNKDVGVRQ